MSARKTGAGGFTLVELVIAVAILGVGLLGGFSLLLALRGFNQDVADHRRAYRVCQRVMELALTRPGPNPADRAASSADWVRNWHGKSFRIQDIPVEFQHGRIEIAPTGDPSGEMYEVRVTLKAVPPPGRRRTLSELNVELVSWSWKGPL